MELLVPFTSGLLVPFLKGLVLLLTALGLNAGNVAAPDAGDTPEVLAVLSGKRDVLTWT